MLLCYQAASDRADMNQEQVFPFIGHTQQYNVINKQGWWILGSLESKTLWLICYRLTKHMSQQITF